MRVIQFGKFFICVENERYGKETAPARAEALNGCVSPAHDLSPRCAHLPACSARSQRAEIPQRLQKPAPASG